MASRLGGRADYLARHSRLLHFSFLSAVASITGIYVGKSATDLLELIRVAEDRIANGDRTALSGAGKSSQKSFSLSAADMLREARFAYDRLAGTGLPNRTHFNASGQGQGTDLT